MSAPVPPIGPLRRIGRLPVVRSLGRAVLVSIGIVVIAFVLMHSIPGDPARIMLGDQATEEAVAAYRKALGLDVPLGQQFVNYVAGLTQGDLGRSIVTRQPVIDTVARRLPVTLWLVGLTVVMALLAAVPLGIAAAYYRDRTFGQVFRIGASISLATPGFFSGVLAILLFSVQLNIAPVAGYRGTFPANLYYLWVPALVLCLVLVPILARVLQSSISETMAQEFVESAIVRGLPRRIIFWRYLLKPSLAPTIALLGYMAGALLGAAVVIELVFNLPGIGTALIDAVLGRDYLTVQGILLVFGMIVVVISFFADVVGGRLDPRTKVA